jgi:hypothetical protein
VQAGGQGRLRRQPIQLGRLLRRWNRELLGGPGLERELNEIREKLNALIKSITAIGDAEGKEPGDAERYRLTLAYYPLKE